MISHPLRSIARLLLALVVTWASLGTAAAADDKIDVAKHFEGKLLKLASNGQPVPYETTAKPQFYLIYFAASW
ncbi:hypothetical protein [Sulfuriroseicoccus oceanibius]|uniref:Uncharacterized protein n=1 Tax=Sulfuriroseicoccus oceanibius TaxID=2707525 RepID=A0A6B3LG52_9BACT|nr:hypothetical protein [Sulfuriroseicoccus oceanibius]QQL44926.1 hypothetical protein G3M56_013830 [Sulfuriroseicoccus oceanibius]